MEVSEAEIESARRDWEDGYRRLLEQTRESPASERLHAQVDAVLAELRRRVGGVFTVRELAAAYADAERWSRTAVAENAPAAGLAADAVGGRGRGVPSLRARSAGLRAVSAPRAAPARSRHASTLARRALIAARPVLALLVGISLGRALEDGPSPGRNADERADARTATAAAGGADGDRHCHDRLKTVRVSASCRFG